MLNFGSGWSEYICWDFLSDKRDVPTSNRLGGGTPLSVARILPQYVTGSALLPLLHQFLKLQSLTLAAAGPSILVGTFYQRKVVPTNNHLCGGTPLSLARTLLQDVTGSAL